MSRDLAETLRFYQELGIDELYRRGAASKVPQSAIRNPKSEMTPDLFVPPTESLEAVQTDLGECTRCKLHKTRHSIVFGSGNAEAEVVFVGEGPGADEDAQGLPFVGRAGQLLTDMINNSAQRMGVALRREHCYICNVVKCRPPNNRVPERDEIEACSPFMLRQIAAIKPRVVVALGATAARTLLGRNEPMHRMRGQWFDFQGTRLMVTFHPSYLLRDPTKKKEAWEDMQTLFKFLYNM